MKRDPMDDERVPPRLDMESMHSNRWRARILLTLTGIPLAMTPAADAMFPGFIELSRTYSKDSAPWVAGPADPTMQLSHRPIASTGTEASFDRIPDSLALSYASVSASGQNTAGLGDVVTSPRREGAVVDRVEVVLVTWARAKDWPAMDSADRKGYAHPVTASLFGVNREPGGAATFSPLGSSTAWVQVPWRPETLENGKPYPYNGFAFKATIPFLDEVSLPEEYAVLVSYNTERTGFAPTGVAGPYNGLNFALSDRLPSAGADVDRDAVLWVKPPQWYYPATNWGSIGSPMIRTVLREGTEATAVIQGAPLDAGSYHLIVRQNTIVTGEAFTWIDPARADVFLEGGVASKGGKYTGASVVTDPPGLPVRVTYNGGKMIPDQVGIHQVRPVIDDPNYFGEAEDDLTVTGPTYQDWIDSMLPAPELRGEDLDPDADGLPNLVEYGLGSEPGEFTPHPLTGWIESRGAQFVMRQKWLPGVDLLMEQSSDLRVWSEVKPDVVGMEGELERLSFSPGQISGKSGFFRLNAKRTADQPGSNPR
jgi:hypothetical protein